MEAKPRLVIAISFFLFILPALNILVIYSDFQNQTSLFSFLGLVTHQDNILSTLNLFLPCWFAAIAIFMVKYWSPHVVSVCIAWISVSYLTGTHNEYSLIDSFSVNSLLFCTFLFFFLWVISPYLRSPYLDSNKRWWEKNPRYKVHFKLDVSLEGAIGDKLPGKCLNFSEGGILLETTAPLTINQDLALSFEVVHKKFSLTGSVSHILDGKNQFGVRFTNLNEKDTLALKQVVQELEKSGCEVLRKKRLLGI